MKAGLSPPRSEPANGHVLLPRAMARSDQNWVKVVFIRISRASSMVSVSLGLKQFSAWLNREGLNEAAARQGDCFAGGALGWKDRVAEPAFQTGAFRWPRPALFAAA